MSQQQKNESEEKKNYALPLEVESQLQKEAESQTLFFRDTK